MHEKEAASRIKDELSKIPSFDPYMRKVMAPVRGVRLFLTLVRRIKDAFSSIVRT